MLGPDGRHACIHTCAGSLQSSHMLVCLWGDLGGGRQNGLYGRCCTMLPFRFIVSQLEFATGHGMLLSFSLASAWDVPGGAATGRAVLAMRIPHERVNVDLAMLHSCTSRNWLVVAWGIAWGAMHTVCSPADLLLLWRGIQCQCQSTSRPWCLQPARAMALTGAV
eukprot:jgi/Ulvmu1/12526/UM090_0013.1